MKKKATEIVTKCIRLWKEAENKAQKELGYFYPTMHLPKECFELKNEFETLTGKDWNAHHESYL